MKATEIETMKPVIPYNLQMFADGDGGDGGDSTDSNPDNKGEDGNNKIDPEPTQSDKDKLNEALARAAKAEADADRYKKSINKLTGEKKKADEEIRNLNNQLRSNMTEDEQRKADEEALLKELKEQNKAKDNEINRFKAEKAYKTIIEDDETLDTLLDAISDSDHLTIAKIISNLTSRAVAIKEAEWKKSRPPIESGNGTGASMTVEEIMAIKDPAEQVKAIAQHKALFEKH